MRALQYTVRVSEAEAVTPRVRRLRLVAADGTALPPVSAGAHTVVSIDTGERVIRNAYSLTAPSLSGGAYEIAVLRTPESRGGSAFIHERLREGDSLTLSAPANFFPVNRRARHHVLVAGGIGITPIAAMAEEIFRLGASFELHYAVRSAHDGAFCRELAARFGGRLHLYCGERQERLQVQAVLPNQPLGTHLYVCGPERMIEAVLADARAAGWPNANLHAERFVAPAGGEPFSLFLRRSQRSVTVGADESVLEAIERIGVEAPHLCRGGACGECITAVSHADGTLDHRDHFLSAAERDAGEHVMICVSRLKGRELVLDL
ncbi:PDR/VanB family oxidoreductase [Jiella sp. MQZ9-1]|uniref:Oxidoreductase n=1 Tax=Jiella flava TaxID=2816857 RepID=A0A939JWX4_9HYPH|nr:PDR/VanB family oxidoreductase [Jiella flava]MBO0663979.1 oxidoreductase [Jiella flava]MCD2472550.1 PDR/VanB family oxidoreductase [Jiella flava]